MFIINTDDSSFVQNALIAVHAVCARGKIDENEVWGTEMDCFFFGFFLFMFTLHTHWAVVYVCRWTCRCVLECVIRQNRQLQVN